jgi:hypothetical protein
MLSARYHEDHLVEMPTRTGAWTAAAETAGDQPAELQESTTHRFIRDIDAAHGQQVFDVTK